jgi:hypothetical protein
VNEIAGTRLPYAHAARTIQKLEAATHLADWTARGLQTRRAHLELDRHFGIARPCDLTMAWLSSARYRRKIGDTPESMAYGHRAHRNSHIECHSNATTTLASRAESYCQIQCQTWGIRGDCSRAHEQISSARVGRKRAATELLHTNFAAHKLLKERWLYRYPDQRSKPFINKLFSEDRQCNRTLRRSSFPPSAAN